MCHLSAIKLLRDPIFVSLFLFLSNYINGKTPREITCPVPDTLVQVKYSLDRFFNGSDCLVALCSYACIYFPWICACNRHSRMLIISKLMLQQKKREISVSTACAKCGKHSIFFSVLYVYIFVLIVLNYEFKKIFSFQKFSSECVYIAIITWKSFKDT